MSNEVCLMYSDQLSTFKYGNDHPMEPERICMVYDLIKELNFGDQFIIREAKECTNKDLIKFHTPEYIDFMQTYNKYKPNLEKEMQLYNIGNCPDTPAFDGFYDFSKLVGGSSIQAAEYLCEGEFNVVLNWIGGLHHAHASQASGFCYINDCVLAIKQLLSTFRRVMYVDIDVHHGDGVEEAFVGSNRVLTLSIHQYGENFFPKTGYIGADYGYGYRDYFLNVPVRKGCTDDMYRELFNTIFDRAFDSFQPEAIVLQCGADSVQGDKLGDFNMSLRGHAEAFNHVRKKGVPLLCLGGGGYTRENVARCWTLESAISIGHEIDIYQQIPKMSYYYKHYTSDDFYYTPPPKSITNLNEEHHFSNIYEEIFDKLRRVNGSWKFVDRPDMINRELIDPVEFPEITKIDDEINELRNYAFEKCRFRKIN